jgi:hypothetical protein
MGFKRPVKTVVLGFEGTDYEGLEIEVRSLPLGQFIELSKKFESEERSDQDVEEMVKLFVDSVKSWNMEEDDGTPVAPTYDNILTFDLDFVMACVSAWVDGMTGPDKDLGKDSNSGETSPALSIPMDLAE